MDVELTVRNISGQEWQARAMDQVMGASWTCEGSKNHLHRVRAPAQSGILGKPDI